MSAARSSRPWGRWGRSTLSASDVVIGGSATDPAAWRTATGAVSIAGNVDLARLLSRIPKDSRPVEVAAGTVAIQGKASRASKEASPALDLSASTEGLVVAAKRERQKNPDGSLTLGPEPWHTEGLDGEVALKLAGSTGRTQVAAKLHDGHGTLATVEAGATLPIARILDAPGLLASLVRDLPIEAKLDVPRRSLDAMPPALGKPPDPGRRRAHRGAPRYGPRSPRSTLAAKGTNLLPRDAATCVQPDRCRDDRRLRREGRPRTPRRVARGREVVGATRP